MSDTPMTPEQEESARRCNELTDIILSIVLGNFGVGEVIGATLNVLDIAVSYMPEGSEDIDLVCERLKFKGHHLHEQANRIRDARATAEALEAQRAEEVAILSGGNGQVH